MHHPATRILAVLELLQAHGQVTGAEMARRLGVDARTLRRYITRLEEMGIPITAERGRHGGYSLVVGFKLPPMMFTADEALALAVGLLAARDLGLAEAAPSVASAQAKLERVMPADLQRRARAIDAAVTLDLSTASPAKDNAALVQLCLAASARRRVHMTYRAADGVATAREFEPYGLVQRGGRWYGVGHCRLRGGLRSFRLDRIESARPLDERFERPVGFDARAHLAFSFATLPRAHAVEVLLHTDLAAARRGLFETVGLLEPVPGGVRLRGQVDDLRWFARELARLPFTFEVRRPAALRSALREVASELLRLAEDRPRVPSRRRDAAEPVPPARTVTGSGPGGGTP
jgi:predicted DNA-binding transcriptional regulator YafY